jgi:hypothetical protein
VPPPYAPPPPAPYGYGYSPNAGRAELTPYPRSFGETLGAIFQLYFKHWGKWLALGLCVALLPAIMGGGVQVLLYLMLGLDPFSAQSSPAITVNSDGTITSPFKIASSDKLILYGGLLAGVLVVIAVLSAWQVAALAIGGREAVLGRRVRVGRALGGGLRRYGPTLGALLVVNIIKYALLAPGLVCFGLAVASISASSASGANLQAAQTGSLLSCLALALLIPGAVGATIFDVRLGLAPYAAATERIGSGAALRKSWQLTRGSFWRVLGIILIVAFAVAIVGYAAGLVGVASTAGALLVVVPLVSIVTAPLTALAYTTLLYDLRLRQEGYAGVMAETKPVETPVAP